MGFDQLHIEATNNHRIQDFRQDHNSYTSKNKTLNPKVVTRSRTHSFKALLTGHIGHNMNPPEVFLIPICFALNHCKLVGVIGST